MSCVMFVSRSRETLGPTSSEGMSSWLWPKRGGEVPLLKEFVTIVRERRGMSFFLVRRIEAEVAFEAERRARRSGWRGTSRLIVLRVSEAAD